MRENISPEDRLLRLIKGKKSQTPAENKAAQKAVEAKYPAQVPASPSSEAGHAANKRLFLPIQNYISALKIQKIIFFCFVSSCVYLAVSLAYPLFLKKIDPSLFSPASPAEYKIEEEINLKPYESYSGDIQNRQIFNVHASDSEGLEKRAAGINADLLKDVNLLGIIAGDNPQVVIEDKKNQKSYYLSKGQFFGEFQIEDIQEGKVILIRRGERFEIYL